jgi:hypothetical protein
LELLALMNSNRYPNQSQIRDQVRDLPRGANHDPNHCGDPDCDLNYGLIHDPNRDQIHDLNLCVSCSLHHALKPVKKTESQSLLRRLRRLYQSFQPQR